MRKGPRTHLDCTHSAVVSIVTTVTATKQVDPKILQSIPKGESVVMSADIFASLDVVVFTFLKFC